MEDNVDPDMFANFR